MNAMKDGECTNRGGRDKGREVERGRVDLKEKGGDLGRARKRYARYLKMDRRSYQILIVEKEEEITFGKDDIVTDMGSQNDPMVIRRDVANFVVIRFASFNRDGTQKENDDGEISSSGYAFHVQYNSWATWFKSVQSSSIDLSFKNEVSNSARDRRDFKGIDLEGYHQIFMVEDDRDKTSFIIENGIYCYNVMLFRLKNAGATYQRLVNRMFKELTEKTMEVYVDDMLIKEKEEKEHLAHLQAVFEVMMRYGMKLNLAKCTFGVRGGKFLRYMVSEKGIEANPKKIEAIMQVGLPKTIKDVQKLTGKVALLACFISRSTDRNAFCQDIKEGEGLSMNNRMRTNSQ
ncbi:UNVERIFIED_CONTAM: Retrovirus-related Pol polyprotein from transposon gypsy [Sesamum radiatum]|uniref:Retrovirus-related Pol polyprotein from transposon gypsy n=1 Tax=Sesamum radiatum TaxID=300843 RepID=A0AAW2K3Z2_SESRA